MSNRISNLLSLCMDAKANGHDCFFRYSPHVERVEISICVGGWVEPIKGEDGYYIPGSDNETVRFEFRVNDVKRAREAEEYLKGLM